MKNNKIKNEWDTHWTKVNKKTSMFGKILEFHRKNIIANSVRHYFEKYFSKKGVFIEMGSGTSQTSSRIKKHQRQLIAFDISKEALKEAKKIKQINKTIQGDIFNTGLKDESVNGIWNLGVMEHFSEKDIVKILNEFERITKKEGYVLLWWPPTYGSSQVVLGFFEFIINLFRKEKFTFFPGEITRYTSEKRIKRLIAKSKLKYVKKHFNMLDGLTYVVVVCKKE